MEIKELIQLLKLPNNHFEGHLILNNYNVIWTLHFAQGRLFYAVDNLHAVRRWNRTVNQYFPKFKLSIDTAQIETRQYWQLHLLDQGFKKQQLNLVRAKLMLRSVLRECLFELSQCAHIQCEWQSTTLPISRFSRTIALSQWEVQMVMSKVKNMQRDWQNAGLAEIAPTMAPTLTKPINFQQLLIPHQYITGKYTLWNIAATLDKSPVEITKSLSPLIQDGLLKFKAIPDLPLSAIQLSPHRSPIAQETLAAVVAPKAPKKAPSPNTSAKAYKPAVIANTRSLNPGAMLSNIMPTSKAILSDTVSNPELILSSDNSEQPLIACIDDSPMLTHTVEKILTMGGYRTLVIHEPMQGFAELIKHMPSLILLDVVLPHTDGYNICRFLRDTSIFKDTPIIILTGRDKPVDRARANMAGATEFLVKPPEAEELLQMIGKHLESV
ncbi:MAG: response regulator [Cyanobacteria bacterium P01_F01_bin.13]